MMRPQRSPLGPARLFLRHAVGARDRWLCRRWMPWRVDDFTKTDERFGFGEAIALGPALWAFLLEWQADDEYAASACIGQKMWVDGRAVAGFRHKHYTVNFIGDCE